MTPRKIFILGTAALAFLVVAALGGSIVETNNQGNYQIKQAVITGEMSEITAAGTYLQLFGKITTYRISDMYYFSKHNIDGGDNDFSDVIPVRFNDGGTANITGAIKYRLSTKPENQLRLHTEYKGYNAVQNDLIRQTVAESLMQTATLMRAEESYSTRRAEFTALAEDQVRDGIYETESEERKYTDANGNEFVERYVRVKMGPDGKPVVRKVSPFKRYGVEILQFVIKEIDFDETIDKLIAEKKKAEQQKVVAKANAEKAKQDAITEKEQGKARVAKAKADEEVKKITAVTEAKKKFEVAQYDRMKAGEEAKAKLLRGEAEARVAKLKVLAGLSPLERATIDKETAIGVAEKLSKVQFPSLMIIGGSGNGGSQLNPFDAVGLQSFIEIQRNLVKSTQSK